MNQTEKQAVKQMIERFFEGDARYNTCLNGEWTINRGGYDLVAEVYHKRIPVAEITCGKWDNKYTIEPAENFGDEKISREVNNLLAQVFDKHGITYESYSFTAEAEYTFKHSGHDFFASEEYKFKTIDFDTFTVKNDKDGSFVIQADQFFGELLENITVTKADKETIKGLIKHFNSDFSSFEPAHGYGDLAVEYGLLKRIPFDEQIDIQKTLNSVYGQVSTCNDDYFSYDWGDGELIDNENDAFFFHAEAYINDDNEFDVVLQRFYSGGVETEILSSEQRGALIDIMKQKMEECEYTFESYKEDIKEKDFKCDCPYLSVNRQNRTDTVIEASVIISDNLLSELLSRCDLRYENGDRVSSLKDLKENTLITAYAQYRSPQNITIELQIDGNGSAQGSPASAWLSATETAELKKEMMDACTANRVSFECLEDKLSKKSCHMEK